MSSLPKKVIHAVAGLGRKAAGLAGRLRSEDDATVPPPATKPSPSPEGVGAPKAGAPGAPKSATVKRAPKAAAKAEVKRSGRGATAKAGPQSEPPQVANGAAATPAETAVPV